MGIINLLDLSVANLIAAGEVVDRPASAVKELLENSIDAGATEVTVEIKNGGITLLRISDNGSGMCRDDAVLCIKRHATSKIKEAKDLDGIMTLGFRGEALAAIASVSKMRIMTKRKQDEAGTLVECDTGNIVSMSDTGCRNGTTIIVEELFANVPARRKFLKKDSSEMMAVSAVVEKIALSRPDLAIKFITDNQLKIQTAGDGSLLDSIYSVLGRDFAKRLIDVRSVTDGIEVTGYIGRPDYVRANRNFQNFFINGRYVRSRTATSALEQAFSSYLEVGKFPCCVLNIVIHPSFVDVNVHPTKLEVKFSNERVVFDAVYCAVRNALLSDTSRPEMLFEKKDIDSSALRTYNSFVPVYDRMDTNDKTEQIKVSTSPFDDLPFMFEPDIKKDTEKSQENSNPGLPGADDFPDLSDLFPGTESKEYPSSPGIKSEVSPMIGNLPTERSEKKDEHLLNTAEDTGKACEAESRQAENSEQETEKVEFKILGLAFNTYIIVETGEKLLMVDKHAAHERIIFEEMKHNMQTFGAKFSQLLIIPVKVMLSPDEYSAAREYEKELKAAGFDFYFEPDGKTLSIIEIPGGIDKNIAADMIVTMADGISNGTGDISVNRETVFERALYQASCKAAIKAGSSDDEAHLRWICEKLFETTDIIRYCPHGRPVAFELSKGNIEHQFKRT